MISDDNIRILVTMPKKLRDDLKDFAIMEGRTQSNTVLRAIQEYLEKYYYRDKSDTGIYR